MEGREATGDGRGYCRGGRGTLVGTLVACWRPASQRSSERAKWWPVTPGALKRAWGHGYREWQQQCRPLGQRQCWSGVLVVGQAVAPAETEPKVAHLCFWARVRELHVDETEDTTASLVFVHVADPHQRLATLPVVRVCYAALLVAEAIESRAVILRVILVVADITCDELIHCKFPPSTARHEAPGATRNAVY